MKILCTLLSVALTASLVQMAAADSAVNKATQNDKAFAKYGLTGRGVIVAFLDRGIDYTHPDFLNANGTTRIKMMWDMSNASSPQSVTFSNMGSATHALGIGSVTSSGDFKISSSTCGSKVLAGSQCTVSVVFKPTKTGTRNGALTIKDFNPASPNGVKLTGTGT